MSNVAKRKMEDGSPAPDLPSEPDVEIFRELGEAGREPG